jgi:hypothetical protein
MKFYKGQILVFRPGEGDSNIAWSDPVHEKNFKLNERYEILKITDDIIYFKDSIYGCFMNFADRNFLDITRVREDKIESILKTN